MKNTFVLLMLLLALVLAACGAQDATNQPAGATANPTVATEESVATEEAGETAPTPTTAVEEGTPTQAAGETGMTPTVSADSGTAAPAAEGTAAIPETGLGGAGLPDDLDDVMRVLRAANATLELGDEVQDELLSVPGQILNINGEEVQIFTYESVEALEAQASQVANVGDPEEEPHYYKLGNMLVRYDGRDPGVRDLLEDVLGAQAAGQ